VLDPPEVLGFHSEYFGIETEVKSL